jgi:hypothetical protein
VEECGRRRAAGEGVADEALLARHPELTPELAEEPRKLRQGPPKVLVRELTVRHLSGAGRLARAGVVGEGRFSTHLGDTVTVAAELSEPAYCYLIAYRPGGTEELCFPEQPNEAPPKTDRPRYPPSVTAGVASGLTEGTGLEAFFLVVSRRPLPAYEQWPRPPGPCPWRKTEARPGLVWRYDGFELLACTAGNPEGQRAKGQELAGGGSALGRLADWLWQAPGVEAVAGVGFPVLPRP